MDLEAACNSEWFASSDSPEKITQLTYPNGKTIRFGPEKNSYRRVKLPLRELAFNQGRIAKVKGVMSVDIPIEVKLHEVLLHETKMPTEHKDGVNFLKKIELSKKGIEWFLSYDYGFSGERGHKGLVETIDSNFNILKGDCLSSAARLGVVGDYSLMEYSYSKRPFKLRWVVFSKFEKIEIPVEFSDVLVPNKVWGEELIKISKFSKIDLNILLKWMLETEDKDKRFKIFSSLPVPEEITEKGLKSYIAKLKDPKEKNRPYAAFAIGRIVPCLEDYLSEFDKLQQFFLVH